MNPPELRKLAARLDAAGFTEMAKQARNRAARRELGVDQVSRAAATTRNGGPRQHNELAGKRYRGRTP